VRSRHSAAVTVGVANPHAVADPSAVADAHAVADASGYDQTEAA
jgi:hypothetical protein